MVNVLSILFCLTLFYLAVTMRVKSYVSVLRVQGLLLTALLVLPMFEAFTIPGLILPATVFIIKVIIIPRYILKIVISLDIKRVIEPSIQQFTFLLLVIGTMVVVFFTSHILSKSASIQTIPFASGFFAIACGLYVIMFRKKLIVHVTGFLILENGIFLFGTAVASELPLMIELGVLLDVFVVVFLMGIALNNIRSAFAESDVTALGKVKD